MTNACIVTPWSGDGLTRATAFAPALQTAYALLSYTDITGQPSANIPPLPNLFAMQCTLDDATAAALFHDPVWQPAILWMDNYRPKDTVPPDTEYYVLCAAFAAEESVSLQQIQAAIGSLVNGRTREEIANAAIAFMRTLTK